MQVDARGQRPGVLIRRGAWTLPAAGLLLGAPWIRPYFAGSVGLSGQLDTRTWAEVATTSAYGLFSATQALGLLLLLFGMFVLHGHLAGGRAPGLALAALVAGVAGVVWAAMMLGVLVFAEPILAGLYQKGVDTCSTAPFPDRLPIALCRWWWSPLPTTLGVLTYPLGAVIVITWWGATWRSGLLPKWVAPTFAIGCVGCIAITPVLTLIGGLLMIVAGGWIVLQLNRKAGGRVSSHDAIAAAPGA